MKILGKRIIIPFLILLIPYIFILYISIARTDGEAILTGGLTDVSGFVKIDSDKQEAGSFNSIYVTTYYPTTILQDFILNSSSKNTVVDNKASNHLSREELIKMGEISHEASVDFSLIVAYQEASLIDSLVTLKSSFEGLTIYYYKEGLDFKVGDIIIEIDGVGYTDKENYVKNYQNQDVGTILTILRDGKTFDLVLDSTYFPQKGYIYYQTYALYDIDYRNSYPSLSVSSSGTSGPSGGLLQSLSIFNHLTSFDYTLGKKIAGTGTLDIDGNVGAIGGIEQKVYTAYENKVDIFFCPDANKEEGLKAYNSLKNKERMEFVVVSTFTDAISYLGNNA